MKLLFVSNTTTREKYKIIFNERLNKKVNPSQKFFDLLIRGMANNQNVVIDCLSAIDVNASTHPKRIFKLEKELFTDNIRYTYPSFYNGRILKYVSLFISSFIQSIKWAKSNNGTESKVIICDPLSFSSAFASMIVGKLFSIKVVAIITDLPGYITSINTNKKSIKDKIFRKLYDTLVNYLLKKYDSYIFLTESMNHLINESGEKPYLVLEGSVDSEMVHVDYNIDNETKERSIVYAGGVNEKFGIDKLVRAFTKLNLSDVFLKIYGSGDYVETVKEISENHPNIQYMGVITSEEIVEVEMAATLLVNPRPTGEPFTEFSFPSKTLEYMVSGTPVLSTRLSGIPKDYEDYLFWFDDETEQSMKIKLEEILKIPQNELDKFGYKAKKFALENKNNILQGQRIIQFIEETHFSRKKKKD